ncbi:transcriptional regulator, LacI family [Granulicella pectinivorans]|jgi:LacI family transcriptional regulator|uniref:Transcriptional regulator, LacI family n=1 Tax=Granulicella pectinivorans TaxID=474950 RepID=A0A1I6L7C4_9BACT|nr:LacI family DNA-binding transcriptional regulator [Granulicella pectinivorans]SFR99337.1 transcriptional regulator, LacI family [Granulicella pectinivorans]
MPGRLKPTNSMPTLVHVAKLAGVGLGTASRALSGQGYVSEETSARIRKAVEQLGYQRNELARSLKVKRSGAIGLVIPDVGGPFMAGCVRAIQKVFRQAGYTCIITFTDGDEKVETEEVDYLTRHQVDGILIVPSPGSGAHFRTPQMAHTPLVTFDQPVEKQDYDAILIKNRHYAREAVEHLIGHGHKRIAALGVNRHHYTIQQRMEGYRVAMKAAGLSPMLEIVDPEGGGIPKQLDAWLAMKPAPTALFSLNELTTLEAVEALAERGIKMPEQIAFIGFDDIQLGPYLDPPLTAVVQPAAEIGEKAARRLLERIDAKEKLPSKRMMLEAALVVRGSCGCPVVKKSR